MVRCTKKRIRMCYSGAPVPSFGSRSPRLIMFCLTKADGRRRSNYFCLFVLSVVSLLPLAYAKFSLSYVNGSQIITRDYFAAPIKFSANNYDFNEDAQVIAFDPNDMASATDKFVAIKYVKPLTPFWEPVLALQAAGARGIIIDHPYFPIVPGALMYYEYDDGVITDRLTLPILELNGTDFADVEAILSFAATLNQTVSGHMDSNDPNPWEEVYTSDWMLAFTIVFGILSAITFGLAVKELVVFIKKDGKLSFSIPQVCLLSIAFGSLWRVLYAVVTPFVMRRVWDASWDDAFATTSFPFSICPVFLVSLYQQELLSKRVATQMNAFLTKLRLPFFIIVGLVFAIDIMFSIIRGLGIGVQLVMLLNAAVYMLIGFVFFCYFFITSIRVLNMMRRMRDNAAISSAYVIVRRLTIWMIISSLSIAYFTVSVGLILVPAFLAPLEWTIVWFNLLLSLYLISLSHIGLYVMRNNKVLSKRQTEVKTSMKFGKETSAASYGQSEVR